MNRNLFLLNGLAILGVVISHAAGWGQIAIYDWVGHIRATVDPSYSPVGGATYYILLSVRQLFSFSVAAFLYVSAWFLTYAVGKAQTLSWKAIRMRVYSLLIPYLIWSVLIFVTDYVLGQRSSVLGYLKMFFGTGATGPYYFVPLLCYLYILSPFLIPLARNHPKGLLIGSGVIQITVTIIQYLYLFNKGPVVTFLANITPNWFLAHWIFFFAFGLVSGFNAAKLKEWAVKIRWAALATCIVMLILAIIEYDIAYRATAATSPTNRGIGWGDAPVTFSTIFFAIALLIYFQTLNINRLPISKILYQLGIRSYGLYLIHMKTMEFAARLIYHFATIIFLYQIIYQPILWVFGFGITLLFMAAVEKTPTRKYYRLLFG